MNAGPCEETRGRLSEAIDGQLSAAEETALESHLAVCPACRAFAFELRRAVEACRRLPRPCADDECLKRAAAAARAELLRRGLLR